MPAAAVAASDPERANVQDKEVVQVPTTKEEAHQLKKGFVDDNNEDIAYFNYPLVYWSAAFTAVCAVCMAIAIGGSLHTDFMPAPRQLKRGFVARYGTSVYLCNSTQPFVKDGLPSLLNLFELNVVGNVFFRCAVLLPITLRVFQAYCVRNIVLTEYYGRIGLPLRFLADLMPILMGFESVSLGLFSIVTTHFDFNEINRWCKFVFVITTCFNMMVTLAVTFAYSKNSNNKWDSISLVTKMTTCGIFCYLAPQYFQRHQVAISFPICHSYLPRVFAYMEYACFLAYALFHLSQLIDIRHVNFMCYPRTCSGECEPLDPKNFEKGAKYEYCRSWEYRQRQILGLPVLTM